MRKGIYKDKNGWKIQTKIKIDGEFKSFTKRGYTTRSEADADFERAKQQFIKDNQKHCEVKFFSDIVREYSTYRRRRVRIQTARIDDSVLSKYCKSFLSMLIEDVFKSDSIDDWFNNLVEDESVSSARKNKVITVFLSISEFSYKSEYIDLEVYQRVTRKVYTIKCEREKTDKFAWTKEEMNKFLNSIDPNDKWYIYFRLLAYTGMRIGEINGLQWKNYKDSTITIDHQVIEGTGEGVYQIARPKNKLGNRKIKIYDSDLAMLLEEYKETCIYNNDDDFIFFGKRPISKNSVRRRLDYYIALSGIRRGTPHTFRHTTCTWMIQEAKDLADLKSIADRQGDSLSVLMDTYVHSNGSKEKDLVSSLSLKEKNPSFLGKS